MWQGAFDAGLAAFEMHSDSLKIDGDTGDETGTYTMKLASGDVFQHGKYHTIWKRTAGSWKMARNDWTIES